MRITRAASSTVSSTGWLVSQRSGTARSPACDSTAREPYQAAQAFNSHGTSYERCRVRSMPRRSKQPPPPPRDEVDLNQVVAYNVRAARELRGWTQDELAVRLEPYLGQRMTQAGVSSIERAWDGDRRREFDAHELLVFALVFELPIIWFLLPPPDDRRLMRATTRQVNELYVWLMGSPEMLPPVYD